MGLTTEQSSLLRNLKKVARKAGKYGIALTSLIGELSVCEKLNLKWQPEEGYDAISADRRKYQVKTRKSWSTKGVNPSGRMGRFGRKKGYKFDQGLFVELDDDFEIYRIWQLSKNQIIKLEENEARNRGLHVSSFQKKAKIVWPK